MAITFIYPIKKTGNMSLDYDTENKKCKMQEKEKNDSSDSINYVMTDKKGNVYHLSDEYLKKMKNYISTDNEGNIVFHTITSSLNCSVNNTYDSWQSVRDRAKNGNKGNLQYCIVQNFGNDINPRIANEIGVEFAQKYLSDYQVIISTHINSGYVHNHIEFNATSFRTLKKFDDNLSTIADIRKISDDLCRKYDLPVLEQTADFNYVLYKDVNGKIRAYEPTERKEMANKKRAANANSYLNTKEFDDYVNNEESHMYILKCDIDKFVNNSKSYEELLNALRDIGYDIKDKTKKGEWRKHISFKLDNWGKAVRDSAVAEKYGEDYLRKNITLKIENNRQKIKNAMRDMEHENTKQDSGKKNIVFQNEMNSEEEKRKKRRKTYQEDYSDINSINEEYKYNENEIRFKRPDIEKYIIKDVKKMNQEIGGIYKNVHDNIEQEARFHRMTRDEYINDCILKDMIGLKFIEEKKMTSFTDINMRVKSLLEKRNECIDTINKIQNNLIKANEVRAAILNYQKLKHDIENNERYPDYVLYEKENDMALFHSYEKFLKEHGLGKEKEQTQWVEQYEQYKNKLKSLSDYLDSINKRLQGFDDCVKNLKRINKEYHVFDNGILSYEDLKSEFRIKNQEAESDWEKFDSLSSYDNLKSEFRINSEYEYMNQNHTEDENDLKKSNNIYE